MRFIKRLFDIVVSLIMLIVLLPLFIVVAIGIKISSRGKIFYRANRVTMNGRVFGMYKFRSMHEDKNSVEKSFIADENRIFPLGSLLRKSKIDELPQLINIFLGDMSFVGPRPASTSNVSELYVGKYKKIQDVRAGLTSYASLYDYKHGELFVSDNEKYINEVLPVKLELELYYIEHWSIATDLKLIIQTAITIVQIVFGKKNFKYTPIEKEYVDKLAQTRNTMEVSQ